MSNSVGLQLLQSFSDAVTGLAESVSPSVVRVNSGRRSGTGIVWSGDGLIVTAKHVVGHSVALTVTLAGGKELDAKVLGSDLYTDTALLKVEASGLAPIGQGSVESVKVGQFVMALANAYGRTASATSGMITSHGRSMRGYWGMMIEDAVVSDARLNPGYSGGPLVDASGRLLGMNVAYFAGRGVAVPVESLKETVDKISKDGRVKKGFLGVVVEAIELPEELSKSGEVNQEWGLLVRGVEAGSPAKSAGMAMGDIIIRLGNTPVTDEYQLHKALSGEVVGKALVLVVLRAEKVTNLQVTPREAES